MATINGINSGNTNPPDPHKSKRHFDIFRPVSVRNGQRIQSKNYCVRFQVKGKRTCRTLGTGDFRLAQQRATALVKSIREKGFEHGHAAV